MTESGPRLLVVGGPNGSGKSTFAAEYVERYGLPYLGADAIAAELAPQDPLSVRVQAGKAFVRQLEGALAGFESLVIESTLAGKGLERQLKVARTRGYRVSIVFVTLDSPALCVARIQERVAQGGHHVPVEDVRRRFGRARQLFWTHYRLLADDWQLFSNTSSGFELIAVGQGARVAEADPTLFTAFIDSLE